MPELDSALLCDHVRAEGGVAHVIAGGIDTVYARRVPARHNLGLLLRLRFTRAECGRQHRVEVILQDTDGRQLAKLQGVLTPQWKEDLPPGWRVGAMLGLNFAVPPTVCTPSRSWSTTAR